MFNSSSSPSPRPTFNSSPMLHRRVSGSRYANIIFLVVGLMLIGFGIFSMFDGENTKDWPVTQGTIQDVDSRVSYDSEGNSRTDYRYVVSYTVNSQTYQRAESSSSYVNNGESRKVIYNPSNPNDTRIGDTGGWVGWGSIVLGVIALGAGVFITLRHRMA